MVLLWSAAPDWPVEYASDNVRQLGYEPDDFISGRVSWPGITHPEDAPRLAAELKDYASRGITEFTQHYRVFRKSGETVWVEDLTRALVDSAGRITRYQGILLDVTARHRAEQELAQLVALRTAEAKEGWQNLRTFLDAVATPALLLEEDGTILLANRAAASRFNTNPLAVNGRSVYTFVTFEEERGGHVMRHTVQPVTEGAARPRRVAVLAVDITEQRRSEQALRKNERLLRDVFDALPDGISVLDRDLTILRTNAVMERTYKDRLPLAGRKCHEVYQLRSAPCQWCPAQEVIRTGRPASAVVPCASSDAATGWIELTALPLLDDRGDVSAVIERTSDVTGSTREWAELKHRCETLEALVRERTDELRRAQDSLTRKERLALLGQFSAGIVDELHGPLSVIRNAAYYLQLTQTGNLQGKGLRHIEMIREAVKQCDALSRNVLEYARGRPPSIKRCGIGELMRKTAGQLALPPGVELTLALPDDLPAALADEFQLGRVIDNLLANAAQALTRGGKVTAAATAGRDTVNISVTDNGPGIASDDLPHIFDPLYSTKAFGAGLSLAVCRLLVEANNGTISVRSRPGKGTTFSITLPAAQS
jgi:PAS domain S-box-containing protein